jgi:RNA polymerase sigma factor (sigma-70 family)
MGQTQHSNGLTEQQRELVHAHLWLVDLHLRRMVPGVARANRRPQRDDLYQAGCMGLIDAVRRYEPDRGMSLPAFALPRIHTAVNRALSSGSTLIRMPRRIAQGDADAGEARKVPRVGPLEHDPADPRARADAGQSTGETIGERLHARFTRAVSRAVEQESLGPARRGDRRRLMERLAAERLLVPREDFQTSLREIARQMGSAIATVVKAEQRLRRRVEEAMRDDPQFRRLREAARANPLGGDSPIDDALHGELRELTERQFMATFHGVPADQRGRMVTRLVESCGRRVGDFVRVLYRSLPREQQDVLLFETHAMAG